MGGLCKCCIKTNPQKGNGQQKGQHLDPSKGPQNELQKVPETGPKAPPKVSETGLQISSNQADPNIQDSFDKNYKDDLVNDELSANVVRLRNQIGQINKNNQIQGDPTGEERSQLTQIKQPENLNDQKTGENMFKNESNIPGGHQNIGSNLQKSDNEMYGIPQRNVTDEQIGKPAEPIQENQVQKVMNQQIQEPKGPENKGLDKLGNFVPPDPSSPEYQDYLQKRKLRRKLLEQMNAEGFGSYREDGQLKSVDDRFWYRDFKKWYDDRSNPRPGPHPQSDHFWNTHPEIFDYPTSEEEPDQY